MTEKVLKKLEAVSLSEANQVKIEARSEIYMKFHVKYSFAPSRHDCVRHPNEKWFSHFKWLLLSSGSFLTQNAKIQNGFEKYAFFMSRFIFWTNWRKCKVSIALFYYTWMSLEPRLLRHSNPLSYLWNKKHDWNLCSINQFLICL